MKGSLTVALSLGPGNAWAECSATDKRRTAAVDSASGVHCGKEESRGSFARKSFLEIEHKSKRYFCPNCEARLRSGTRERPTGRKACSSVRHSSASSPNCSPNCGENQAVSMSAQQYTQSSIQSRFCLTFSPGAWGAPPVLCYRTSCGLFGPHHQDQ